MGSRIEQCCGAHGAVNVMCVRERCAFESNRRAAHSGPFWRPVPIGARGIHSVDRRRCPTNGAVLHGRCTMPRTCPSCEWSRRALRGVSGVETPSSRGQWEM